MNFKFIFLLLIIALFCSCGVKSNPIVPREIAIKSYLDNDYLKTNEEKKENSPQVSK